jgi:hypothetical protein
MYIYIFTVIYIDINYYVMNIHQNHHPLQQDSHTFSDDYGTRCKALHRTFKPEIRPVAAASPRRQSGKLGMGQPATYEFTI